MARKCIFCESPADSREHLWSDWILEEIAKTVEEGDARPVRINLGKHIKVATRSLKVLVKCVCKPCNNTWMSDLEGANKPHTRAMLHGEEITLEPQPQKLLARWAILKAMVLDDVDRKRTPFYTQEERAEIKRSSIPSGTAVWIGRISPRTLHAGCAEIGGNINKVLKAYRGCVTTIIVGHLVIQVLSIHVIPMFANARIMPQYKPDAWDINLLDIWPVFGNINWPPPLSFTHKGSGSIGALITRFNLGEESAF